MSWEQRLVRTAIVCAAAIVLASLVVRAQSSSPSTADFAGTWVLDQKASEGPEKAGSGEGRGGGPPGGGGGGFSGGMMGFGGPGGPPDRARMDRMRRIMQAELKPPHQIVVAADGKQITFTADEERPETVIVDGKKHLRLTGDGEINTITKWIDGLLVSERHYDEGIKATRSFRVQAIDPSGTQLIVLLKLEGGHAPKRPDIKFVYTRQ
ncbi:MAG: hypothetical protein NTY02_03745 [Acidobacteria bacterium]|nr:hypothetical protein [Acidobacteriota bacterium]